MLRIVLMIALLTSLLWLTRVSAQDNTGGIGINNAAANATPKPTPWFSPEVKVSDIIGTVSVFIALGSLVLVWLQRKDAKEQKRRAEQAQTEAAEQKKKAERAEAKPL